MKHKSSLELYSDSSLSWTRFRPQIACFLRISSSLHGSWGFWSKYIFGELRIRRRRWIEPVLIQILNQIVSNQFTFLKNMNSFFQVRKHKILATLDFAQRWVQITLTLLYFLKVFLGMFSKPIWMWQNILILFILRTLRAFVIFFIFNKKFKFLLALCHVHKFSLLWNRF